MKNNVSRNKGRKYMLFMKISTLILTILSSSTILMAARPADAQDLLKKHITVNLKNSLLVEALDNISTASGVKFTYNGAVTNSKTRISVKVVNQELGRVLNKALSNTSYTFIVLDDEILIRYEEKVPIAKPKQAQRIVTGKVVDEKGEALPGVTIRVKNTTRGGITDASGKYQIQVNDDTETLVFAFIGYQSQEVVVADAKVIDIKMVPNPQNELKEVAVVAYGTQRKVSLVGAQSTVDVGELKQPVANISTLLAGRLSGIVGVQRSGEPGGNSADIWIRGISTFTNNATGPLVLVDGVTRSINNLDPQDIQSFTILKDASATAVYGVRGANGVILVQTKRGKAGKPKIDADYYEGFTSFTRVPEMADGITFMNAVNEANTTRGGVPKYSQQYIQNTQNNVDPLLYPNINWMDAVFKNTSRNRRANVNINGGAPNSRYYISASYYNEGGLLKTDKLSTYNSNIDYSRYNFTSNVDLDVTKSTKVALGVQGYVSKGNYPSVSSGDIFQQAMIVSPVVFPLEYPGGFVPGVNPNGDQRNPYADLTRRGYRTNFENQLYSNIRVTQDLGSIIKGLTFNTLFAFDAFNSNGITRQKGEDTWYPDQNTPYKPDGTLNLVRTYTGQGNYLNYGAGSGGRNKVYTESSLNYDRGFSKHRIGGLLLFNQEDESRFPADNFTTSIPYRLRSLAGRVTYSYSDKYFAEFNVGYNGSENFAPDKRYGYFPAFGLGWLVSEEKFFEPVKNTISFFKIRYSNGIVGSADIGLGRRFGYLTLLSDGAPGYTYGQNNTNGISGINITDYGVDVTWSRSHKQDLGFDIRAFHETFSLTFDLFKEHRSGIFLQRAAVPGYVGLSSAPYANLGIVENKGFDATIEQRLNIGQTVVNLRGNVTYNKDVVIENDQPSPKYPWNDRRGHNILADFGYVAEGLFTSQEEINNSAVPGSKESIRPGDIKYRDLNNDGIINAYDRTQISKGDVPFLTYGVGFNVAYKGFNLGAFFQGTGHASRYISGNAIQPFATNGGISNAYANITDRWTEDNPSQDVFYPRLAYGDGDNTNNTQHSSWWIKDVQFIRLKTLDVGYTFPKATFNKFGMSNARIYIMGYNLFTISDFKLWDPELNTGNGTTYPNVKTISLGISAQFN
ncbi:TonB-dependent receptor [Mucilaginibacter sp. ZT4R22]|uniref:TonB-dependent receptor n=1 Tax=Mucilaginibacter pankratovii TaxID=2772110 RepID=A0ABR7WLF6_9SPHI|nr:TonB-dependent receptor [Mucilaginibacter pankratovii]MBD1363160.1 TonB-dependent receptor [Mucilaginibacter pankratovii]